MINSPFQKLQCLIENITRQHLYITCWQYITRIYFGKQMKIFVSLKQVFLVT